MLLYSKEGTLIKINKLDYTNDKLYYKSFIENKIKYIYTENNITKEYPVENIIIKKI
tara:strand:+ start:150 stop:320 length:171 start_codon:yes stop_codon:yes gene_type:complete